MQNARSWSFVRHRRPALAAALAIALSVGMAGCSTVIDAIPTAAGGLPDGAPERPATAPDYLPVGDTTAARENRPLTDAERMKLEAELAAMRSQHEQRYATPPASAAAASQVQNPKAQADAAKASQASAAAPN
jgi:hypothetical protein